MFWFYPGWTTFEFEVGTEKLLIIVKFVYQICRFSFLVPLISQIEPENPDSRNPNTRNSGAGMDLDVCWRVYVSIELLRPYIGEGYGAIITNIT